jgi:hypothetical protein
VDGSARKYTESIVRKIQFGFISHLLVFSGTFRVRPRLLYYIQSLQNLQNIGVFSSSFLHFIYSSECFQNIGIFIQFSSLLFQYIHSPESSIILEPLPVPFYNPFTEQSVSRKLEPFPSSILHFIHLLQCLHCSRISEPFSSLCTFTGVSPENIESLSVQYYTPFTH